MANVANIGVTLLVARLLTTRGYGALNQLVAVFFVLSIPGSALLVGIVRRVTLWQRTGHGEKVAGWAFRTRRRALVLLAVWIVVAIAIRNPLADQLSLPGPGGLSETLIAGGVWGVLCVERGLLQASHAYRAYGVNLLVEGLCPLCADHRAGRGGRGGHRRRHRHPALGRTGRGARAHRTGVHQPAGRAGARRQAHRSSPGRPRSSRRRRSPPSAPVTSAASDATSPPI